MNALILAAATLAMAPAPSAAAASTELHDMFEVQKQELLQEIHDDFRNDVRQQGMNFFAADGELRRLLARGRIADPRLAAR